LLLLLPATFCLNACNSGRSAKNVTITGAFALYPIAVKWADTYKTAHPEAGFDISGGGAGKGLTDVLAGAADLGMFSRKLTDAEFKKGIWYVTVTTDAVLPTISAGNPYLDLIRRKGLTQQQLAEIFTSGKTVKWSEVLDTAGDEKINVYTRSDAAGAADTWAAYLNGGNQENIKGTGIYGDPGLADAVARDPLGIGFNNTGFVYNIKTGKKNTNIEVIPLDLNGDRSIESEESFYENIDSVMHAIAVGKYPSPPARPLYFISKGKPDNPQVIAFLKWVLTDGQSYVKEAGYVPLDANTLKEQLAKLQ
jgi:phosphate transport system substrate-binding protein